MKIAGWTTVNLWRGRGAKWLDLQWTRHSWGSIGGQKLNSKLQSGQSEIHIPDSKACFILVDLKAFQYIFTGNFSHLTPLWEIFAPYIFLLLPSKIRNEMYIIYIYLGSWLISPCKSHFPKHPHLAHLNSILPVFSFVLATNINCYPQDGCQNLRLDKWPTGITYKKNITKELYIMK